MNSVSNGDHQPTVAIFDWPSDPDGGWISSLLDALPSDWISCAPQSTGIPDNALHRQLDCADEPAAILSLLAAEPGGPVGLIRFGTEVPPHCWNRLLRSLHESHSAGVVSPLSNASPEQAPVPMDFVISSPEVDTIDRLVFLHSQRRVWPGEWISPLVSLWSRQAIGDIQPDASWHEILQWQISRGFGPAVCDHCYVQSPGVPLSGPRFRDLRDRPAASFLEQVRAAVADNYRPGLQVGSAAGLDSRPVLLHILHSWGGGIARWVQDLADSQPDRHHLFLCAWANPGSSSHGQELRLYAGRMDLEPISQWVLPRPVASTTRHDEYYQQVLHQVLADFAVDAIYVSSLIGHTLDPLTTSLPTLVVFHDYYPSWPILQVAFEADPAAPFDGSQLDRELTDTNRFKDKNADGWMELRSHYLEELARPNVLCTAPSASVVKNLQRLDPRFKDLTIEVIPHGLRALDREGFDYLPPGPGERLRLLVPGRITVGKGKTTLLKALAEVTPYADIYLVGAGKDGEAFFGLPHVHLILNYDRQDLTRLMAVIKPHLALLLSTVSETFSYTLSEVRSLGIPAAATTMGAFPDRIEHGVNGWLVEPHADALSGLIKELSRDRESIARIAARGALEPSQDLEMMGVAYSNLLPLAEGVLARYRCNRPRIGDGRLETLSRSCFEQSRNIVKLRSTLAEQERELKERDEWGRRLEDKLHRRTRWAEELEQDLDKTRRALEELQAEFEDRTRWALDLVSEVELRDSQIASFEDQVAQLQGTLERIINSRSWRLTKPLRFGARKGRDVLGHLGFQSRRAATLAQRTQTSIKVRGVSGTVDRIRNELRKPDQLDTQVPAAPVSQDPVNIPGSKTPQVSIVIPVYNQYEHTRACLHSIANAATDVPYEVIVVDDASSDETKTELERCTGLTALRNAENAGFIKTCNRGADQACGDYLVFLNNDTAVADRWLDHLLDTFDRFPDAGLVGAKLVYPDGRLQEAGGVVFADASGWNYGRFEDRNAPEFNYVREVDYVSGACAMISRALFDQLGHFDLRYVPAYYEDTDLAFAVRAAGKKAYYQPLSVVTHFEGITSGTDLESGTKRFQAINQRKFQEKWADVLTRQPAPGTAIDVARRHRAAGSVLIVDACTPTPDQDSGSLRMVNLMQLFLDLGWHVRFLPDNRRFEEAYSNRLQQMGVEVLYQPFVNIPQTYLSRVGQSIDAVILSRHYVAKNYIEMVRKHCPNAKLIFDTVDLHYLREQRLAELEKNPELLNTARKTRAQELDVARRCDLTLVVSEFEKEFLASDAPELTVGILSNIHNVHGCRQAFSARKDLMFVGGFQHPPNVDAVQWFVNDILPLIRQNLPHVTFNIIGSKAPLEVKRLGRKDGVEFHGYVENIEPFLDGCRLAVAPLRYGAGVKGKVNMSMSYGQPVVASPAAVEGLHIRPGEDVLVGDSPEAFSAAVVQAYGDEKLWNKLSAGGLANVDQHFSFAAAQRALKDVLSS